MEETIKLMKDNIDELLKRKAKIKQILKEYDGEIKAYAVLDTTIELIRKEMKKRIKIKEK